ncbi:MAG: UDP-N-acetylglucosamine 2-epimerase (hydrolyzing), partial [Chitinophagia bacterium]|nr:UDP-N-acetylglucosamine 2-epimerase (hydrolyzing) [Chitinophagia bacterium]
SIYVIGSPDIDVMNSTALPSLQEVRDRYKIKFETYAVVLFHPVTTELKKIRSQAFHLVDSLMKTKDNFIVIFPNNDHGNEIVLEEYEKISSHPRFQIYPSIRFEHFLSLLKNAKYIIGNSSAGVREAPHFGVPAINLGSRQNRRVNHPSIINTEIITSEILKAIDKIKTGPRNRETFFGDGKSTEKFYKIICEETFWQKPTQKYFVDRKIT